MAISRREALKRGISYGTGVMNHGNDSIVYDRDLRAFAAETTYADLRAAVEEGDAERALPLAHEFRQRCAHLAMSELFLAAAPVEAALEEGSLPAVEELDELEACYRPIADYLAHA